MKIGEKLRLLRDENNYTLKQLSQLTGISISFISDIEHGRRIPGLDNLKKLADGLKVPASELITEANIDIPTDITEREIFALLRNLQLHELEALHIRPEIIELIDLTRNATKEDVLKTIKILKAIKDK